MANFFDDNESLRFQLGNPLMRHIVDLKEDGFSHQDASGYSPLNFEDALDNYGRVLSIVGEICAETLAPNAEMVDAQGPRVEGDRAYYHPKTQENHEVLAASGLYGMSLPREYGGLNFPIVPYVMAAELVSRADAGFANIWGLQDCAETIHEFANEEQKRKYLPLANEGKTYAMGLTEPDAGSDLQAVMLRATYDEEKGQWFLNGVKRFITNGDADVSLVMARSEEGTRDGRGISLFIYDKRSNAVKVRRIEHKMGIVGSPTCELVFTNAPAELVGERKLGLIKYVMSLMNGARLGVGAQSVGLAEAAYREALKYAHEREQFGSEIVKFPAVYEMLALMKAKEDACRAMLYETSRYVDVYKSLTHIQGKRKLSGEERKEQKEYQKLADAFTPILKLFSSEQCNQICYDAIQIHGGSGFMKDYPVERYYRDARILTIYEGTSQLQVVAAIKGVTSGLIGERIAYFDGQCVNTELVREREALREMSQTLKNDAMGVLDSKSEALLDFHARRLVEMAGYVVLGYLLLIDAQRDASYARSARVFVRYGQSVCEMHHSMLCLVNEENLKDYSSFAEESQETEERQ